MSLCATTLLATNTEPMLAGWVDRIRADGIDIGFDRDQSARARLEMVGAGEVDVLFACGLLTIELVATGAPLEVVAAPIFAGEEEPVYRSVVVARADGSITSITDAAAARLAVNEYASWSGWHGYKGYLRSMGLWPGDGQVDHVCTGGHIRSIEAVLAGEAGVAAIDQTVWDAWEATDERSIELVVVDRTPEWPAPPLSLRSTLDDDTQDHIKKTLLDCEQIVSAAGATYEFMLAEQARH